VSYTTLGHGDPSVRRRRYSLVDLTAGLRCAPDDEVILAEDAQVDADDRVQRVGD
jgi:hypothetical protein